MKTSTRARLGVVAAVTAFSLSLAAQTPPPPGTQATAAPKPALAVAHKTGAPAAEPSPDVVKQYCTGCHSEKGKAGGLSLVGFDPAHADQQADVAERMVHKLRLGMMPPPGARRPAADVLTAFVSALETRLDAVATLHPTPG